MRTPSVYSLDDPLSAALQPPPNETKKERTLRLEAEAEAQRLSDQIDEELEQERQCLKLRDKEIKVLLFGEAKNIMKQFQLMYKPHLTEQECISLKTVIYLNIVRALKHILTTLEACNDTAEDEINYSLEPHSRVSSKFSDQLSLDASAFQIADLRRRLRPLVSTYELLADYLHGAKKSCHHQDRVQDIPVPDVVYTFLKTSEKDIKDLWDHTTVKALIAKQRLKLNEGSEFFLNHISRVVDPAYDPSIDDILHVNTGVQEHVFDINIHGKTVTWHLYDVGLARGQRHSWVPYFDDINAIIFVASVSDFDQYLEEDPHINKIDNSLQLFTQICSNSLLKGVHRILILNKTDLLKAKLDKGVKVWKYISSFGERSNDYDTVIQYFRAHFLQVHRQNNRNKCVLYTHFTNVIDTKIVQGIVENVHGSIMRRLLQCKRLV